MIGQHFQDVFLMIIDDVVPWMCADFQLIIYIYIFSEFCGCYIIYYICICICICIYIYIYQVSLLWFLSFSINSEMFGQKLFFTILIYFDLYILIMSHDEPSGGPWQCFHFGQLQQHVVPLQLSRINVFGWSEIAGLMNWVCLKMGHTPNEIAI